MSMSMFHTPRISRSGLLGPICLIAAVGCDGKASHGKVDVGPPPPPAAPAAPIPQTSPVRYDFSPSSGSTIRFVARRLHGSIEGSAERFSGTIVAVDSDPARASVTAEIDMRSLRADDPHLTLLLQSPALFDVVRHPSARFVSTGMKRGGDMGATNTVTGDLELKGITRSITIPMTLHLRPNGVDVDAEVAIHRKEFGIVYPGKRDALIKDEVLIELNIYGEPVNAGVTAATAH
jgi:polyisoprenoid-binding protein YceI